MVLDEWGERVILPLKGPQPTGLDTKCCNKDSKHVETSFQIQTNFEKDYEVGEIL